MGRIKDEEEAKLQEGTSERATTSSECYFFFVEEVRKELWVSDKRKFPPAMWELFLVFVFSKVRQDCLEHTVTKLGNKLADIS